MSGCGGLGAPAGGRGALDAGCGQACNAAAPRDDRHSEKPRDVGTPDPASRGFFRVEGQAVR
jgi:hypothetical protein